MGNVRDMELLRARLNNSFDEIVAHLRYIARKDYLDDEFNDWRIHRIIVHNVPPTVSVPNSDLERRDVTGVVTKQHVILFCMYMVCRF